MPRVELGTSSLPRKRSTPELHRQWLASSRWTHTVFLSGRRDSNSRHSAWKADALPTELLPLAILKAWCGDNRIRTYSVIDNRFTVCPGSPTPAYPRSKNPSIQLRIEVFPWADGGIRTPDPLITNQLLWPTELHRPLSKNKGKKKPSPISGGQM